MKTILSCYVNSIPNQNLIHNATSNLIKVIMMKRFHKIHLSCTGSSEFSSQDLRQGVFNKIICYDNVSKQIFSSITSLDLIQ